MKTTRHTAHATLSLAAALFTSTALHAAPVIYEPFAYTTGGLNGKGGTSDFGFTGNWTASADSLVSATNLQYGALATTGGSIGGLGGSINRFGGARTPTAATLAPLLADGTTLWFSVIVGYETGANNTRLGFALANSSFNTGNLKYWINNEGAQLGRGVGFSLSGNGNGVVNASLFRDLASGDTTAGIVNGNTSGTIVSNGNPPRLLVGSIAWGAGLNDVITIYAPNSSLALGTAISTLTVDVDQSTFDTFTWARGDKIMMDEVRFGANQADVMPLDTVAPTLLSITDNMAGGPIGEDVAEVTYTLTFDKPMDLTTITSADFNNAGGASATVGAVAQVSPTVFTVKLVPTTTGTLQLRIPATSVLSSFVPLNLDTTSDILDNAITIDSGATPANTPTTNRWWDGTTITGATNGVSAGGAATWDNGTTTNWDRGVGFEGPVAWDNSAGSTAIFGGTGAVVTLGSDITLNGLTVNLPTATATAYSIGNVGEDNTLTFAGAKTVTTTATGTGTNQDVTIRAGISGSPTMNIAARATDGDNFNLLPGTGVTQTIGTLNMLNTFAGNKKLILGGTSTGNVVDTVTWPVTANQLSLTKAGTGSWTITNNLAFSSGGTRASRLYVEQGTLTLGGTANFFSHKVGVATTRGSTFTASGTASKLIAKGTITIGDNREFFYVQNLGTLSPGPGVETLNVTWNANSSTLAANGEFNMQTGSTYEWDIASSTSTDVINVTTGASNNGNLILGNMTIKINDAGVTTPIAAGDQLPVFTYETGAQEVVRSIGTITLDNSALGAGWSGTPSLVDNGSGTIYITGLTFSSGSTPYDTWAASKGLTGLSGSATDPAKDADPDKDGSNNLSEFAFNGNPLSGSDNGKVYVLTEDSDFAGDPTAAEELILTVAVRTGTPVFAGSPSPSATHDGITYRIEGSLDLASFLTTVNVVPTPVVIGLPVDPGAGYEYRSFSLDGSDGLSGKGFLRAKVTSP